MTNLNALKMTDTMSVGKVINHLQKLNTNGVTAFVAGGWVRDYMNAVKPKDIDIFVVGNGVTVDELKSIDIDYFGITRTFGNSESSGNSGMREDVVGVVKYDDLDVDIVVMKAPTMEDVVNNFDVSICQIVGVLEGDTISVYATDDYLDWGRKGVIYHYTDIPTTENHLERVRKKYNVELTEILARKMPLVKIGELYERG